MEHYLRYFEEGYTLRELKGLCGNMKAHRVFYELRSAGWIAKKGDVWRITRRGWGARMAYLRGDRT